MILCRKMLFNLVFGILVFASNSFAKKNFPTSNMEIVKFINDIVSQIPEEKSKVFKKKLSKINSKKIDKIKEEKLLKLVKKVSSCDLPEDFGKQREKLEQIEENLVKILKNYNVTGFACVGIDIDPNFAFLFDSQNPTLNVSYKDSKGNVKIKKFVAQINSVGIKAEAAIKIDFIFLVNTDLNFYKSDKVIELGMGIDANIMFNGRVIENLFNVDQYFVGLVCGFTYVPFKNVNGGILIISYNFGFVFPLSLSVVYGGSLTPV
ncbi:hypothetical protein GF322_00980 [Candidatus Dependentiae bacterium]|nr:hypothetical protein [Candidatus Dependentiae bacterium]